MKKNYLLSTAALLIMTLGNAQTQVVNGNFETVKPNNLISNWGMNILLPIAIDTESGETTEATIAYGSCWGGFVNPTFDAHHGQYAMQLTNALNITENKVIPAKALLFNDATQDFPGWNAGVPLTDQDQVTMLGFYYKFFPAGNDVARAELILFDDNSNEIGRATADITQASGDYSYLYAPVDIIATGTPAFMNISFTMDKPGSTPAFGSALIVDDVVVNFAALAKNEFQTSDFAIFPTAADESINVLKGKTALSGPYRFTISNIEGKIVDQQSIQLLENTPSSIDVSRLEKGIYFLESNGFTVKFVKK